MIAGRLHWKPKGAKLAGKIGLAAFDFTTGTLTPAFPVAVGETWSTELDGIDLNAKRLARWTPEGIDTRSRI